MHAHREGAAGLAHPLAPAVVAPIWMIASVSMFRIRSFLSWARGAPPLADAGIIVPGQTAVKSGFLKNLPLVVRDKWEAWAFLLGSKTYRHARRRDVYRSLDFEQSGQAVGADGRHVTGIAAP